MNRRIKNSQIAVLMSAAVLSGYVYSSDADVIATSAAKEPLSAFADGCPQERSSMQLNETERTQLAQELRSMITADQIVRRKVSLPTTSDQVAAQVVAELNDIDDLHEYVEREQKLSQELGEDLDQTVMQTLKDEWLDLDNQNNARLIEMTLESGWPSEERTQSDVDPITLLLHMAPETFEKSQSLFKCEVVQGRMSPKSFANVHDKYRQLTGQNPLYATGNRFDPATGQLAPPLIDDLSATNAARASIGLDPITDYELAAEEK